MLLPSFVGIITLYTAYGITGDPAPSSADLQLTRQLREAAWAVDIAFLDHVIVGDVTADPQGRGYYPCRGAGVL